MGLPTPKSSRHGLPAGLAGLREVEIRTPPGAVMKRAATCDGANFGLRLAWVLVELLDFFLRFTCFFFPMGFDRLRLLDLFDDFDEILDGDSWRRFDEIVTKETVFVDVTWPTPRMTIDSDHLWPIKNGAPSPTINGQFAMQRGFFFRGTQWCQSFLRSTDTLASSRQCSACLRVWGTEISSNRTATFLGFLGNKNELAAGSRWLKYTGFCQIPQN